MPSRIPYNTRWPSSPFDSVNIGDGVSISVAGDNPLHIDVVGDATINSVIDLNASTYAGLSVLGGGYGGTVANHGTGPPISLGPTPTTPVVPGIKGAALPEVDWLPARHPVGEVMEVRADDPNSMEEPTAWVPTPYRARLMAPLMWMPCSPAPAGVQVPCFWRHRGGCHQNYCGWKADYWKGYLC